MVLATGEAGACASDELHRGLPETSRWRSLSFPRPMNPTATIPTDLLTPLGAYLRLRGDGTRELPARVGRAGPARAALVRRLRARGSSPSRRRRRSALPVVGYLAYDHVAKLEPTVPLPADGPGLPESRFVVAETLVRFDHGAGVAEVLAGDPDEIAARLERARRGTRAPRRPSAGPTAALPGPGRATRRRCARCKEHIRAGDAFQIVLSQRAERPTSASRARRSTARCGASIRRRTSSCSSSTASRSSAPRPRRSSSCEDGARER